MRKNITLLSLITLVVILTTAFIGNRSSLAQSITRETPPSIPYTVYGQVQINGQFVPAGTSISAWCSDVMYAEILTTISNKVESWYSLDIPRDDPLTTEIKEGCSSGEEIIFKIGEDQADETTFWGDEPMGLERLDLSVTNLQFFYIPLVLK